MKKILFIPTYTYLSTPVFTNLLPELNACETIYLDIEEQYPSKKTSSDFKSRFTRSLKLDMHARGRGFIAKMIKFLKMIVYRNRLRKLIKKESPSAIVSTGDLTYSIRVIKMYFPNIPIFVIQPALFVNKGIRRRYSQVIGYVLFNKILRIPIVSKQNYFGQEFDDVYLLLWGNYFQNMLTKRSRSYLVGDLTLDHLPIKRDKEKKQNLLKHTGYTTDTKIVTICTSVLEGIVKKEIIDHLHTIYQNLITSRQDLYFIIKLHPRNDGPQMHEVFESLDVKNVVITDNSLHELFAYTDIHISSFSRTAVEAIASNIPIVVVNPDNLIVLEDFFNNALSEKVTNAHEMNQKIEDILKNRDDYLALGEQYIEDKLYKLDGKSAQRAAEIIKREIEL